MTGRTMPRTAPARLPRSLIPVTRRVSGLLHGDYSGLLHRAGSELGDTRRYLEGDDVRRIDWPATARTNETQVHDTIADHELDVWMVVDASASMAFGTARSTKYRLAADVAAAIGYLICQSGNRLGCVVTGSSGRITPRSGIDHLAVVLAAIERAGSTGTTEVKADAATALAMLLSPRTRGGLVVVISDFLDGGWASQMGRLSQRHDVIAISVADPREFSLPNVGVIDMQDAETGRVMAVDTARTEVRTAFAKHAVLAHDARIAALRSSRVDVLDLRTDSDWPALLAGFLRTRKRRLAAGARR